MAFPARTWVLFSDSRSPQQLMAFRHVDRRGERLMLVVGLVETFAMRFAGFRLEEGRFHVSLTGSYKQSG